MILTIVFSKIGEFLKNNASAIIATIITIISFLLIVLISKIILQKYKKKHNEIRKNAVILGETIVKVISYIAVLLTIIIILNAWNINVMPILIGIGVILIVFLFSAHKLIYDLINGICLILNSYYEIDDVIEIDGFKGKVLEITLRSTKLINWKNQVKIINNGKISSLINYSLAPTVSKIEIAIAKSESIDKVITLLDEKLITIKDSFKQVIEGPYISGITKILDDRIILSIIIKCEAEKQYEVIRFMNKYLIELFQEENIQYLNIQCLNIMENKNGTTLL